MALDHVFYPYAVRLPSPEITHFVDISADRGYQTVTQSVAGRPTPCFVGVASANPSLSFTTQQVKSVLDVLTDSSLVRDLSADTVSLYYRAGKVMGIREDLADSVHAVAQLANSSMLYWTTISAQQGSVASVQCQLVTAKRGVADTMVWTGSQPLPVVAGCQRLYGMGPVYHNGVLLSGVSGWTLTSNVSLEPVTSDGEKANSYIGVRSFHPQVRLQSNRLAEITNSSFGGDEFNTLELYLQRMTATDIYDDAANPTHIKITVNGGLHTVGGVSGSPASVEPMFYSIDDGVTVTHTWNTATSIT